MTSFFLISVPFQKVAAVTASAIALRETRVVEAPSHMFIRLSVVDISAVLFSFSAGSDPTSLISIWD